MKTLLRIVMLLLACGLFAIGASAQTFTKPIRVIVPYPAGDLADIIARLLAPKLEESLGQSIFIDNRPGASGLLGLQAALQGSPDNHTFVLGQMGSMAVAPITHKQTFDVRTEFVPVAMAYTNYMVLVASPTLPVNTLAELIAYSKANPGKVRLATNGEGGFPHLAMEQLKERSGLDFQHIPYKGSGQPMTDVIGGQVDLTVAGFSTTYPQVKAGRLKAIAVTGKDRSPNAPNLPTVGETVPGYQALGWFGYFAPKGTSQGLIATFNAAVNNALKDPGIREKAEGLGLDADPGTPSQFGTIWRNDYDRWSKVIHRLNLDAK